MYKKLFKALKHLGFIKQFLKMEKKKNQFLTRAEAAQLLRVSIVTLDAYIRNRIVPAYGIGRRVLLKKDEVINAVIQI
jgi:excisionase family DNA binding protein